MQGHFAIKRDVEQGAEVFQGRRRCIADFGGERVNIEREPRLPLAHWREVGPPRLGGFDCNGELMVLVLELSLSLVRHRGRGVQGFSPSLSPLSMADINARRYDHRADN